MEKSIDRRNRFFFGMGTIGRDMFYTMVSMYLIVYITEVLDVSNATLGIMTAVLLLFNVFDAEYDDPIMGLVVDNLLIRFGKFKPWILIGALVGSALMLTMFGIDLGLTGWVYAGVFAISYLLWDVFGLNDIAYWSMMPSLSTNQQQRERIGSFARICANIGLFAVVVGIATRQRRLKAFTGSVNKVGLYLPP